MSPESNELFPWLSHPWDQLLTQHQSGRLPHALLVSGPGGCGKRLLADHLVAYVLCAAPNKGSACGQCKSCRLLTAGSHPDLFFLEPEEPGKAIKIDTVRGAAHFTGQTSQLGGYRCILVAPAENLNINAANALLKILEEPGESTLFVLVSGFPSQIAPTVRSRCNKLVLSLPSLEDARTWLRGSVGDAALVDELLAMCHGSPLEALAAHQAELLEKRTLVYATLAASAGRRLTALEAARKLDSLDLSLLIDWWYALVADTIKWQMIGELRPIVSENERKLIAEIAAQLSANALYLIVDALMEARQTLLSGYNPNKILMLEDLLIRWSNASQAASRQR